MGWWQEFLGKMSENVFDIPISKKFVQFIHDNPWYNGVIVLGSGTVVAQVIGILSMPVITRLYIPSDLGILAVYSSILAIVAGVASFRYEFAIPLSKQDEDAANLFILCLLLLIGTSIGFTIIVVFAGKFFVELFHLDSIGPFLLLLIVGFFGLGLYTILNYWAVRQKDYRRITYTRLNQSAWGAASKILLGALSFGPFGLLIGYIISQIAGIGTFFRALFEKDTEIFRHVSIAGIKAAAKEFWSFPAFNFPGLVLSTISMQLPPLILLAIYDTQVVGLYYLAYGLLVLPGSVIGSSIGQVFHGEVATMYRQGSSELYSFYLKTVKHLTFIAIPVIGTLALLAPIIFPVIFGEVWIDAGYYCLPLALMVIPGFVAGTTNKLDVFGYNHWVLIMFTIQLFSVLFGFFICGYMGFSIFLTLTVYAFIMLIIYIGFIILNLKAIPHKNPKVQ